MRNRKIERTLVAFFVGLVFALGLAMAGMTQPQKIIDFLDPWNWDPALLFVMMGAVGVHAIAYPLVRKRKSPLFDTEWHIPSRKDITPRLVLGSALFGIGWGVGGFCPGPGLAALVSGDLRAVTFVATMIAGMFLFIRTEKFLPVRK